MITIGLMSGTSMDGIDGVVASWRDQGAALPELRASAHRAFPTALRNELLALQRAGNDDLNRSAHAANGVAAEYAELVSTLLKQAGLQPAQVLAAGAHGVTVRHAPVASGHGQPGISIQLLNAALLAERSGVSVVHDVRSRDIAAGGQGAPLVPAFHAQIFGEPGKTQVVLNLGGIANITVLRRDGGVVAFDTGPGNLVIDQLVEEHSGGRLRFDRGGRIAASGKVSKELLTDLMSDPYYKRKPPKTAGREEYGREFIGRCKRAGLPFADLIATVTVLTAATVALAVGQQAPDAEELIVSGGGAHNPRIMAHLASLLAGVAISTTSDYGVDVDAKEAILFALMAHETWLRRPSNVPQATGARRAVVLGKVSY